MLIGEALGKRLINVKQAIDLLAHGDFNIELSDYVFKVEDEVFDIGNSIKKTSSSMGAMIKKIKNDVYIINDQSDVHQEKLIMELMDFQLQWMNQLKEIQIKHQKF